MPTTRARSRNSAHVGVQYAAPRRGLPSAASLRRWALAVPGRTRVTVRIVGVREARALNRAYRKRDYPTNVLSFPYGGGTGDLVLCRAVIEREAREQGKRLAAHYAHLVVHGMLHLRGLDHDTRRAAARMEAAERRILRRIGFADPYAVE